ncbi:MAG: MiaB/RimO family radical SAM methylthiotransferase [Tepidisphaeraceae bacterium]|jgi:threonylcarbamoyladenosine tRNA methylthiotransferase MtaB
MRTFSIQTLGCKVNQYESEQMATLLRARGWTQTEAAGAGLRIVHTCAVTTEAASKSRSAVRRMVKLPVLGGGGAKTVVTGCWATCDCPLATNIPGVDAVITNHENVAARLEGLIEKWSTDPPPKIPALSLPLLGEHQDRQRAFLKIQDGCDAHCTYCIIPSLRPSPASKSITDAVEESKRLVAAGHLEIVLTGIFLGAYGYPTALRRRQEGKSRRPIRDLIEALCTQVPGLKRLRLSSLEPGDLDDDLLETLASFPQVVPHFHLPLQSGSDVILRRMNRQYRRDDFLRMVDHVRQTFDRPALTTDIIVGFPGETDAEFEQTLDVAKRAEFIHIHAFAFSARPGTAAARWTKDFVRGPIVGERIDQLADLARQCSYQFRKSFLNEMVQVAVERNHTSDQQTRHGRCERYFDVEFADAGRVATGYLANVRITDVHQEKTVGILVDESLNPA